MKKEMILAFVLFSIVLLSFNVVVSKSSNNAKVNSAVYEQLDKQNEVRVVVDLKEPETKVLGIIEKSAGQVEKEKQEIKKNIADELGKEKIKHDFQGSLALEISKKDLENLENNKNIDFIVQDTLISAFLQQSALLINATQTWALLASGANLTGAGETVCVIDSGINFNHADLKGKNFTCNIDCIGKTCTENCSAADDFGHGTHVAGIVGARGAINGVARDSMLIGVKVLNSAGIGVLSDLKSAIDWCASNSSLYNISVIVMSLGTETLYSSYCDSNFDGDGSPGDDLVDLAGSINSAILKNISVIAATGNNGSYTAIASPACIQNATAVGWANKDDSININSNRNSLVKLFAPGTDINSTYNNGNYAVASGTSMAAPHVAASVAIIKQFLRLTGQVKSPAQIQEILNSTGRQISDGGAGGSNLTFSRINIYDAVLSLDNIPPNVTLVSPANNHLNLSQNQTFSCNATDWQLANITFYLWNSSNGIANQTTSAISGSYAQVSFNLTNLSFGNYKWNCLATDVRGNSAFASANFSLTIGGIETTLISPANNNYTTQANWNFTCLLRSIPSNSLTNVTFYLWNSSSLVYNETKSISGSENSSQFSYILEYEDTYEWSCLSFNNASNFSLANNFTIAYDITKPTVTLLEPADATSGTTSSYNFTFNVSDTSDISSCYLVFDNTVINFLDAPSRTATNGIYNSSLGVGSHTWQINCTDMAGNTGNSTTRSLTITSPPQQASQQTSGSGSSGGAGKIANQTKNLTTSAASNQKIKEDYENKNASVFNKTEEENKAEAGVTGAAISIAKIIKEKKFVLLAVLSLAIIGVVLFAKPKIKKERKARSKNEKAKTKP